MANSFIFYEYFHNALRDFDGETYKQIMDAVFSYVLTGNDPKCDGVVAAAFHLMKPQIDRGVHMLEGQNGRRSGEYADWRKKVFERDDYTCQMCGKRGGKLNAHHIKEYAKYPNLRYEVSNGVTLCEKCHKGVHHGKK